MNKEPSCVCVAQWQLNKKQKVCFLYFITNFRILSILSHVCEYICIYIYIYYIYVYIYSFWAKVFLIPYKNLDIELLNDLMLAMDMLQPLSYLFEQWDVLNGSCNHEALVIARWLQWLSSNHACSQLSIFPLLQPLLRANLG